LALPRVVFPNWRVELVVVEVVAVSVVAPPPPPPPQEARLARITVRNKPLIG